MAIHRLLRRKFPPLSPPPLNQSLSYPSSRHLPSLSHQTLLPPIFNLSKPSLSLIHTGGTAGSRRSRDEEHFEDRSSFRKFLRNRSSTGFADVEEASKAFTFMVSDCYPPCNDVDYSFFVNGLDRMAIPWTIISVFSYLRKSQLKCNGYLLNIVLKSFYQIDKYEEGMAVVGLMVTSGVYPDSSTLGTMLNGLVRLRLYGEVFYHFHAACRLGIGPSDYMISAAMIAVCDLGFPEKSLDMLNIYALHESCLLFFNITLRGFLWLGQFRDGFALWMRIQDVYNLTPDLFTLTTLVQGLTMNLSIHDAIEGADLVFSHLVKAKIDPDIQFFNVLLNTFVRGGKLEKAVKVFDNLSMFGLKPDLYTYNTLIFGCSWEKVNHNKGFLLYVDMCANGVRPDARTLNQLIKLGSLIEKKIIIGQMIRSGPYPTEFTHKALTWKGNKSMAKNLLAFLDL